MARKHVVVGKALEGDVHLVESGDSSDGGKNKIEISISISGLAPILLIIAIVCGAISDQGVPMVRDAWALIGPMLRAPGFH